MARPRRLTIGLATAFAAAAIAACGSGSGGSSTTLQGTIDVTFLLDVNQAPDVFVELSERIDDAIENGTVLDSCVALPPDAQLVVTADGETVGVANLDKVTLTDEPLQSCHIEFEIPDVADHDFYELSITGDEFTKTYSKADLDEAGWNIAIEFERYNV